LQRFFSFSLLIVLLLSGCGYGVGGRADALPKTIQTIAIPAFANATVRYKLTDQLPEAISREFIGRTRYRIVADPAEADAVLKGTVTNVFVGDAVLDPNSNRAGGARLFVQLRIQLVDQKTGKPIWENTQFDYRARYEISTVDEGSGRPRDRNVYFDESDQALERLSREVARSVVSAILEKF
jgi:hypothetical protein